MKNCLIFDLDGTISEPAEGIAGSINYALEQSGFEPIDPAGVSQHIGPPLDKVFRSICADDSTGFARQLDTLVKDYRVHYNDVGYAQNVIFEGVPEALHSLRDAGVAIRWSSQGLFRGTRS